MSINVRNGSIYEFAVIFFSEHQHNKIAFYDHARSYMKCNITQMGIV